MRVLLLCGHRRDERPRAEPGDPWDAAADQPTSGGGVGMSIDERARVVSECRPEPADAAAARQLLGLRLGERVGG